MVRVAGPFTLRSLDGQTRQRLDLSGVDRSLGGERGWLERAEKKLALRVLRHDHANSRGWGLLVERRLFGGAPGFTQAGVGTACGSNAATSCGSADSCDDVGYCQANDLVNLLSCEDCPAGEGMCNGCLDGACLDCMSVMDSFDAGLSEWSFDTQQGGGWGLFAQMPGNENGEPALMPTDTAFLGNDGSTLGAADGTGEQVLASITSPVDVVPDTLEFDSWNLDEGGIAAVDDKRIELSVDGGETWTTLADCSAGVGDFAFCQFVDAREADDWDEISIDTSAFAGMMGQLRFTYLTIDSCCGFEYGWYLDNLNFAQACPDANPASGEGGGKD